MKLTDAREIITFISEAEKKTPVKVLLKLTTEPKIENEKVKIFGTKELMILKGDLKEIEVILKAIEKEIIEIDLEYDRRNSAIDMLDITGINARIEPGAVIREHVTIENNAVIMMGAVINIGAYVGEKSMIDMGAILGGRAIVGKNCHIGAGAVLAGVIEPPSANPVVIENDVLIGANAVILEGVRVGENSVVAAGSIVTTDVPANSVVVGSPAKVIKEVDAKTKSKTEILTELRNI